MHCRRLSDLDVFWVSAERLLLDHGTPHLPFLQDGYNDDGMSGAVDIGDKEVRTCLSLIGISTENLHPALAVTRLQCCPR